MSVLNKIGQSYGTDKSSDFHNYLHFYEKHLGHLSQQAFTLMELGVGPEKNKGKSLLTWRDYFPLANIIGVDIRADAKDVETDRISVEIGDCGNLAFLSQLGNKYKPLVIIDDASHRWSHQIIAFETLFPHIPKGGIYFCEDLGTSYPPASNRAAWSDNHEDAVNYFLKIIALSVGGGALNHSGDEQLISAMQKNLSKMISEVIAFKGVIGFIKK
jgi:hypothetical protein